ncbi:MAG: DUF2058 domain-containing protein [Thiotrichales bacterium]
MKNALQDQLRKAGLIDDKKIKKAKAEQRQQEKQQRKGQTPLAATESVAEAARRAADEKARRDRELNQQRQAEAARRALAAQVRQIIEAHRQPAAGEIAYQFADGGAVKRLFVNAAQQQQLVRGLLAVARFDAGYALVPAETARKIRERDPESVVVLNEAATDTEPADDPYADYKIPDDLMW